MKNSNLNTKRMNRERCLQERINKLTDEKASAYGCLFKERRQHKKELWRYTKKYILLIFVELINICLLVYVILLIK